MFRLYKLNTSWNPPTGPFNKNICNKNTRKIIYNICESYKVTGPLFKSTLKQLTGIFTISPRSPCSLTHVSFLTPQNQQLQISREI